MQVNIELPEDVSQALQERWGDVSRRSLEAIALEGYWSGALTVDTALDLDPGEREAIALARQLHAELLVIDVFRMIKCWTKAA
jgi:predicted nucleic acid-binding protein